METMQLWETYQLIDSLSYTDVNQWEQTRLLMTMLGNMFSKNKITATDIIKFPWDHDKEKKTTKISEEDINKLKKKAEQIRLRNYGNNTD